VDHAHLGEFVLPSTLPQLNEEFFVQVCKERWSETHTLEFKAVLPKGDEDARQEFRKDVCAMANADGGDLVFGISDVNGCANAVLAINDAGVDATKRRLQQILESKVEPRIHGIQFHACPIAEGGFVLVLRIPSSYEGPHRFGPVTEHRFPIRNDTSTTDMTYEQLRNTFGRESTLLEKAAQFRVRRVSRIVSGQTPRKLAAGVTMALHIVPMCGLAGRANVDVAGIAANHDVLRIDPQSSWKRHANLDGVVMYPYDDPNGVDTYAQIFRDGCFEIVKNVQNDPQHSDPSPWVVGHWVGYQLRDGLKTYAAAAPAMEIHGPIVVSVSLMGTSGTTLTLGSRSSTRNPIFEDRLEIPEIVIQDISEVLDLDKMTKPIMDVLYQCYGERRCNLYDDGGKWNPPR
jgi:Putative DNA-binding domain